MNEYTIEMYRSPNLTRDEISQRLYNAFSYLTQRARKNEQATSSDNPGRETPLVATATTPEGAAHGEVYQENGMIESSCNGPDYC